MTIQQLEDKIISLTAKHQQRGFEKGEHDRPWCAEAEEQYREFFRFMSFESKLLLLRNFESKEDS